MFADVRADGKVVTVRLSRRNVEDLVKMLANRESNALCRKLENGVVLNVFVEENNAHYANRETPQGPGYRAPWAFATAEA